MKEDGLYSTRALHEHILYCDNQEDFKQQILSSLQDQRTVFQEKIAEIMEEGVYTVSSFAKSCGVSRMAVKKWCDGALPQSRELFIRIGFAAGYDLNKMNQFLQRFGKYPALYSKSLEDSVYIFVLNSQTIPHTFAMCETILQKLQASLQPQQDSAEGCRDTVQLLSGLMQLETEIEMLQFVEKNRQAYSHAYEHFYGYIREFIDLNRRDPVTGKAFSLHALAELQGWSSSLRKAVAAIERGTYFPLRRKILSLGLHLNMRQDQLNLALRLAGMEELYAKNPIEGALIYALQDAELRDMIQCDGSTELWDYVCSVLRQLDIPEAEEFLWGL